MDSVRVEVKNLKTKETVNVNVDTITGKYAAAITVNDSADFLMTVKKEGYSFSATYISTKDTSFEKH